MSIGSFSYFFSNCTACSPKLVQKCWLFYNFCKIMPLLKFLWSKTFFWQKIQIQAWNCTFSSFFYFKDPHLICKKKKFPMLLIHIYPEKIRKNQKVHFSKSTPVSQNLSLRLQFVIYIFFTKTVQMV